MEKQCGKYTLETLSCYVDKELSPEESVSVSAHLETCEYCSKISNKLGAIGDAFHQGTQTVLQDTGADDMLQQVLKRTVKKSPGLFQKVLDYLSPKLYLKIVTIVAIIGISLVYFQQPQFNKPTGPSAIVNSVDGDISSVMIIETLETKHTIIWFSET